ncbi:MAG TPA: hypothetical protein ENI45_03660, partial [Thermoplasmatales archaeon]|nr:hypothetical protein [Thermoplasmatales archaeon]
MKPYNTLFIAFTLFQITFNLVSYPMGASNDNTWDPSWSFYKEIKLNVDTSDPGFHYQPVDIHVTFSNTCWALDEKNHSIRVMVYHDNRWDELESQIYNLSFIDDSHIKECNLVFLIPSYADGNERYYLYYDDEEKPSPSYQDHVSIKEETFYYEPITGYKADLRYYKIIDDGYCLYGVGLGGELIGLETVHKIIKQKNDATVFSPRNWVQMASFAFFYAVEGTTGVGTDEVLVSKDILVDGNLMVRFKISSKSSNGKLETDAAYTYYHCPTSEKRIIVDVSHRVVETAFSTGSAAQGGSFGYLASSKTRSVNIRELNSGFIPPYVHFFSEEQTIREYSLPQNPHSSDYEWVLSPKDDTDLGSRPWVSLDEGSEGYAYALILSSSTGLYSMGRDGVQIEAGSEEFINVPGFEMDGSGVSIGRNSVEPGEEEELTLPAGLEIRFSAEFFTTEEGGYPRVDKETMVFQILEKQNVRGEGESRAVEEVEGEYALTVIPSLQGVSRPLLAAASALPIPTVEVQLHKEGSLVAAG